MRIGQKVQPPQQVRCIDTLCDLCGDPVEGRAPYDRSEVTLEACLGDMYPDGTDYRKIYSVDICPDCFLHKVKPAVEVLGLRFRERDADDCTPQYNRVLEADESYTFPARKKK